MIQQAPDEHATTGVLKDIRVLDLSWGIAGPMAGMILADHGAKVIKIEPPGGDPFRTQLGYKAWQRGKRSSVLDLKREADKDVLLTLVRGADVLIESFSPGTATRLGIDYDSLQRINPRLVYGSITGYGRGNPHSDRPGYDSLVAARTGLQWELRGWPEGPVRHMNALPDLHPELDVPPGSVQGPERAGPLFSASNWPSLGAFFALALGISAALRAREVTGRGQWVETSLLQGALCAGSYVWQRAEHTDVTGFDSWVFGSKASKGHFRCKDGRWIHNWVPNPRFILAAGAGAALEATPELRIQNDPDRIGTEVRELVALSYYQPALAATVAKFDSTQWVKAAVISDITLQAVRPPEEALVDTEFLRDGCVVELDDPELGATRQVGICHRLHACPTSIQQAAPSVGEHTDELRRAALHAPLPFTPDRRQHKALAAPLQGIRVLDLGAAIAGPFGTQLLADLGAEVIKINNLFDQAWHRVHIAYIANRGKRSIALNIKTRDGMKAFLDLVKSADVVHHNMRYDAARRLGIDYDSLREINPRLIYCHLRGYEDGPRRAHPGNDQTGACLAGVQYEDGGMHDGGKPFWSNTSMGDTGAGFLSAIAVVQAIYHRDRTGEGQFVDTSIVNACLLNTSYALARPDGSSFDRPRLDYMQYGFSAGQRLYQTLDGWLSVLLLSDAHWNAMYRILGITVGMNADLRGSEATHTDAAVQHRNDSELARLFEERFRTDSAAEWFQKLDAAGVPVEICDATFATSMHRDPGFHDRGWIVSFDHPQVGRLEQMGSFANLSDTPLVFRRRPPIVGEHSEEILRELGYRDDEIARMKRESAIGTAADGSLSS